MRSIPYRRIALLFICGANLSVHAQAPGPSSVSRTGGLASAPVAAASSQGRASPGAADGEPQTADVVMRPLIPGTKLVHTVVVDGVVVPDTPLGIEATNIDAAVAAGDERLIYSNTLGRVAVDFGANRLISDDITTTALGGCGLSRISFDVDGRVNEALPGGAYTVSWALYNTCPNAVTAADRNARFIPGSTGNLFLQDDDPTTIVIVFSAPIPIPNRVWLGLTFSRANAGAIMGAPAMVGFTTDRFDFPGSACTANLGRFPNQPHASFNVQMWGLGCSEVNLKYQNMQEAASSLSGLPNRWITDDITLIGEPCLMRGYSVGVRGPGTYDFELRSSCKGLAITGTEKRQIVDQSSGYQPRIFEYVIDPPILLPQAFAYAVKGNNPAGGPIANSGSAQLGSTSDLLEIEIEPGQCKVDELLEREYNAFFFSVLCDGPGPVGACCDMYMMQCVGGLLDGEPCWGAPSLDCSPGTCEPICRDVPQVNCPFPPNGANLLPAWDEGKTCSSDGDPDGAFPNQLCGEAACCTPDDTCLNLTRNECEVYPPAEGPHQWQEGLLCGENDQYCPFSACLAGPEESCGFAHEQPGCSDMECCQRVCSADPWCCRVEWDRTCIELADSLCLYPAPRNDSCGPIPFRVENGAELIQANSSILFTYGRAIFVGDDEISCATASEYRCVHEGYLGQPCGPNGTCSHGSCVLVEAYNTLWFRFTARHTSAQIGTCDSPTAPGTSIHVFTVGEHTAGEEPCDHLSLVSCTALDGCGTTEQACLCVEDLTVGEEYYIMIGSSSESSAGVYQLDITSPCDGARCCPRQDCNNNCVDDFAETIMRDAPDCNGNRIPDECDLTKPGADCNGDGSLDACRPWPCDLCPQGCSSFAFNWDFDCDRDLRDVAALQNCFSFEPSVELGCCYVLDYWPDQAIDLSDYYYMYDRGLDGPMKP